MFCVRTERLTGAQRVAHAARLRDDAVLPAILGMRQSSVVVDTGADGLCDTVAADGDIPFAAVGSGSPNRDESRRGANEIVDAIAAGDDVQRVAFGAACRNATTAVVDAGANGIADAAAAGDDTTRIPCGTAPASTPCVLAGGGDGVARTPAPSGDDGPLLAAGAAEPDTGVVRCGPHGVADTTANDVGAGDDVQLIAVGAGCSPKQVVVDSGADGIATTRAAGPDLRISAARPVKIDISGGKANASKLVTLAITNTGLGATAPSARTSESTTTAGSRGGGGVTQVDADAVAPGLEATGSAPLNGSTKARLVATVKLESVTTVANTNPEASKHEILPSSSPCRRRGTSCAAARPPRCSRAAGTCCARPTRAPGSSATRRRPCQTTDLAAVHPESVARHRRSRDALGHERRG